MFGTVAAAVVGAAVVGRAAFRRPPQVVEGGHIGGARARYLYQRTPTHFHRGIDIGAPHRAIIRSLNTGEVLDVSPDCARSGYGQTMLIRHVDGTLGFYAHIDEALAQPGSWVRQGEAVARVGVTGCGLPAGRVGAPHLHLEVHGEIGPIRGDGRPQVSENIPRKRKDPEKYIQQVGMRI